MTKTKKSGKKKFEYNIPFEKEVTISVDNRIITVKGPKGENKRRIDNKRIDAKVDNNMIIISTKTADKRIKKMINSLRAHLKNMILGVTKPFSYKLKICSGHFPMKVSSDKTKLTIQNFLGEKVPRVQEFPPGVDVKVDGDHILVESPSKELAGQTAASFEQLTRRTNYDTRIFQDGCYIIKKADKILK